jgi:hypothetical protein
VVSYCLDYNLKCCLPASVAQLSRKLSESTLKGIRGYKTDCRNGNPASGSCIAPFGYQCNTEPLFGSQFGPDQSAAGEEGPYEISSGVLQLQESKSQGARADD